MEKEFKEFNLSVPIKLFEKIAEISSKTNSDFSTIIVEMLEDYERRIILTPRFDTELLSLGDYKELFIKVPESIVIKQQLSKGDALMIAILRNLTKSTDIINLLENKEDEPRRLD